jgi:SAM-dependent methyltransferase
MKSVSGLSRKTGSVSTSARTTHWDAVYRDADPGRVSWYQASPVRSLEWIRLSGIGLDEPLIDVGAGNSRLVDTLSAAGYGDLTVLDVSAEALRAGRERLGPPGDTVDWRVADITRFEPTRRYALWHDRAVLHFLVDPVVARAYADVLARAVRPGGFAIIATFAVGGPRRCSGLDTLQYDADRIRSLTGERFELLRESPEIHRTPGGSEQLFAWFLLRRVADD